MATNPFELFFSLGNKITGGDPKRLADWNYYMMWIMFLAFSMIMISNLYNFFFVSQDFSALGWALVMFAILWFQYQGLTQTYHIRKMLKGQKPKEPEKELKAESIDEMLEGFKEDAKQK